MVDRPHLIELAGQVGILPEYRDIEGRLHRTSDASYEKLLDAMGFDASTEQAANRSLDRLARHSSSQVLAPVRVVRSRPPLELQFDLPLDLSDSAIEWRLQLQTESGDTLAMEGCVKDRGSTSMRVALPHTPEPGYHALTVRLRGSRGERVATQRLVIAPERCLTVQEKLGDRKVFGLIANLYTVRSDLNWGVGDLSDLSRLCTWAGRRGAEFVGLNPLHALRNTGHDVSPYSPVSRLFRNVIYLDVAAVPEFCNSKRAQDRVASKAVQEALAEVRNANMVRYDEVFAMKLDVLRLLFNDFGALPAASSRRREFSNYRDARGECLARFAAFQALETHFQRRFGCSRNWRQWPAEFRRPDTHAVAEFRAAHAADVEFHAWLQFELDRQLAAAASAAQAAKMRIGLYPDLAIGSSAGSSDTWAYPDLFVVDARVGAPPDDYARAGQDWGLPPIHPLRLREDRYEYWSDLLRANFAHSGALRIDHVMGLLRQYWIPPGATALEGAYVGYPANDLFGILALESHRHRAIVIGEDLGTVPDGFTDLLRSNGVLSCQVMYFQRGAGGEFLPGEAYSDRALVTSTTHDHVPLAGFFSGADLRLRRSVGSIESDDALVAESNRREVDKRALLERVQAAPPASGSAYAIAELTAAVHRFLAKTPAPLLGLLLDDLAGEQEPVNLPGVGPERHAFWSRRMAMSMERLQTSLLVATALAGAADRAESDRRPTSPPHTV